MNQNTIKNTKSLNALMQSAAHAAIVKALKSCSHANRSSTKTVCVIF